MIGAVRHINPTTGRDVDDARRGIDTATLDDDTRHAIFEANARPVYPRMSAQVPTAAL
ncbi:hypothetical protein ABLE92_15535 [Gordonia sp. VNQ95]|uniref:hypothetical protein n=1 Tax=Gordonia sp. VNQ95 TaxID=3156619 RepID=UPI0032B474BC